jgi:hypothetical protein
LVALAWTGNLPPFFFLIAQRPLRVVERGVVGRWEVREGRRGRGRREGGGPGPPELARSRAM